MTDRALESALRDLGENIDWPPSVDFSTRLRLDQPLPRNWRRRVVWIAAVVATVLVVYLVPAARQAVANLLDVAGIRIEFGSAPDLSPPSKIPLGELVDLEAAQNAVDFPILRPTVLDNPGSVHLLRWRLGTQVFLAWGASDQLPEVGDSGIGVLLVEFRADLDEPFFSKLVQQGTTVDRVTVNGAQAFWLAGAPHVFMFETGGRDLAEDSTRLTGNVLIWEAEGITYRLESNLGLEDSLAIAESLSP